MGGFGSGRPSVYWRSKVENCHDIDVNWLHRNGCLAAARSGTLGWSRNDEEVASIRCWAEENRIVLAYRSRTGDGDWEDVKEPVRIVRTPCRFGGTRPYFICPGVVDGVACGRRVAKLYADGRYFLCRHCNNLTYSCQSEDALSRALRRSNKIRLRLGGQVGMRSDFPPRPKGMWWRTYTRLWWQANNSDRQANQHTLDFIKQRFPDAN